MKGIFGHTRIDMEIDVSKMRQGDANRSASSIKET